LEEPKNPETDNVYKIYSLLSTADQKEEMRRNYLNGNYGYGHAKQALYELILNTFSKERELYNQLVNDLPNLDKRLLMGAEKARAISCEVLNRVRKKVGF
ncbi:MAG TPA: tryptophan--tRNA ligase, partial [Cytophagaceae bacterium]